MRLQSWMEDVLPFALMVMTIFGDVCNMTISKAAMDKGMRNLVFIVYYNVLGTFILLPVFIFHRHRSSKQSPLSFSLLCRLFALGLIGISLVQICGFTGINYSSPTLAAAMGNLVPAFTFLLAVFFRMERFDFRKPNSQAKSLGTIVTVSGAFVMTLYKGPALVMSISPSNSPPHHQLLLSQPSNWVLGGLLFGMSTLMTSMWNIAQTATIKEYPDEMTIVFFYCLFGTIQCAIFSLIAERNPSAWMLRPGIEIIAVVVAAISAVIRNTAMTWCLHKKGPVYVAMFLPTQMVIAVILGVLFLHDTLHLGSVIGGAILAIGFYTVMWGKAKEGMTLDNESTLESSRQNTPLLQNTVDNVSPQESSPQNTPSSPEHYYAREIEKVC